MSSNLPKLKIKLTKYQQRLITLGWLIIAMNFIIVGISYTNLPDIIPAHFNYKGESIILKNPLDFKVDLSIRDTKTTQRTLDGNDDVTAGSLNFQLRPNINYQINRRLNAQLFFERTFNEPRVPSSFKRSSTSFGIKLRFNLA